MSEFNFVPGMERAWGRPCPLSDHGNPNAAYFMSGLFYLVTNEARM